MLGAAADNVASLETQRAFLSYLSSPNSQSRNRYRQHVHDMGAWMAKHLKELGAEVELRPLGKQVLDGQEIDLPPAVLGSLGNDPKKVQVTHLCQG
jgi:Cys-Gly metallodipeptidase DUG1